MATKTKSKFGAAMFDSIKAALNKTETSSEGQYKDIMKFPAGHTYTLRLLPNVEDPEKTLYHHWQHGWKSKSNGKYMSYIGLQSFNERDPINELRWKLWKEWKEANPTAPNKDYVGEISQKEQWLVGVYVIDDPSNAENNDTVKVLRMGPQIKKLIDDATEGDRSDELGWDIFDPTKGHDLKIKATKQGDYTTFEGSFFTTKSKTVLTEEEAEELCVKVPDLTAIFPIKTYSELESILDEHFFNSNSNKTEVKKSLKEHKEEKPVKNAPKKEEEEDDDIPMFHGNDEVEDDEDDIDSLLAELDND
jgi:hypothetical protein